MNDLRTYTKALTALLIACIVGEIFLILGAIMVIRYAKADEAIYDLDDEFIDYDAHLAHADFIDAFQTVSGLGFILIAIATAVLTSIWMYRATDNLRSVGLPRLRVNPAMAAAWWYVPFANLAMPFVAMTQIFKGSKHHAVGQRDGQWMNESMSWMLPAWWTLWILSNFIANMTIRMTFKDETLTDMAETARVEIGASILSIAAASLLILIVRQVSSWQSSTSTGLSPFSTGQPNVIAMRPNASPWGS